MLQVAEIFQSGMILQREKAVAVWGTAEPGAQVTVEIQGRSAQAKADESGAWSVSVPALAASASETMTVKAGDEALMYEDVAVGEVWLAGGQSNMEFAMRYEKHKAEALENCEDARVRFYDVPEVCYDGQRRSSITAGWLSGARRRKRTWTISARSDIIFRKSWSGIWTCR